jgi:hypothetical protein
MSPGLFMKLRKIQFAFSSCVSCHEKYIRTYVPANWSRLVHIAHRLRREKEREKSAKESVWILLSIACTSRANSGIRPSVDRYLWTWMLLLLLTGLSCFCEITRFNDHAVAHVAPQKYVIVQVRLAPFSLSLSVSDTHRLCCLRQQS